jgi:lon-related putative ATP-dependent protease
MPFSSGIWINSLNFGSEEKKDMKVEPLKAQDLYRECSPDELHFESTAELEDWDGFGHQPRAIQSLEFGTRIDREGYNIFALGEPGMGKYTLVSRIIEDRAGEEPVPDDLCYVNNFEEQYKPHVLLLPAGRGKALSEDMNRLIDEMGNVLRAAFENEENQNRRQRLTQEHADRQQEAIESLQQEAKDRGLNLFRMPGGYAFAPVRNGEVVPPEEYGKLPEEEKKKVEEQAQELMDKAQKVLQKIPQWERDLREELRDLDREITRYAVGPFLNDIRKKYEDVPKAVEYLDAVEKDIIENAQAILRQKEGQPQKMPQQEEVLQLGAQGGVAGPSQQTDTSLKRRYQVNVVVDHSERKGAPVVYESNPTYQNLIGRVEHRAHMGTLLTDFNMIRGGALHRANGGYLILDALKVLMQPFAWEGLKRALRSREIKIESLGQIYNLVSTVSLEPEPASLKVKVALLGSPLVYYLLRNYDPEFQKLFKVAADFDYRMDRNDANQRIYGKFIAAVARREKLRPFESGAVARTIEHGARILEDKEKLSVHLQRVADVLREADYWAQQRGGETVSRDDVQQAIDARIYRSDRIRGWMQEQIERGTFLIDTDGSKVGQVNGLSVLSLGDFSFGRPNRITARVRLGKGDVVDIEREVEMGGPIHSKGVLILAGFLGGRYAGNYPLSLSASLVFEQSYSGIEGDSASSAELYALLSAISGLPVKQSLAVTGSVNQHGQVQPIGGVNEKIEGFFDACRGKGLTGEQGVLIPESNVKNLMLRRDVIEAAEQGKFRIFPIRTVDEGITLLTGVDAGETGADGKYPEESVNGIVCRKLEEFAEKQKAFGASGRKEQA